MAFACHADAQPRGKIPHVGILLPSAPSTAADANLEAFRQGLRDLGYVEGRNIILEYRWAENREDQYPALVADLIRLKVDIIFTSSTPAVLVAKQATKTIPIVFPVSSDPVSVGIVDSFARPGGNATGLSSMASSMARAKPRRLRETTRRPGAITRNCSCSCKMPIPSGLSLRRQRHSWRRSESLLDFVVARSNDLRFWIFD